MEKIIIEVEVFFVCQPICTKIQACKEKLKYLFHVKNCDVLTLRWKVKAIHIAEVAKVEYATWSHTECLLPALSFSSRKNLNSPYTQKLLWGLFLTTSSLLPYGKAESCIHCPIPWTACWKDTCSKPSILIIFAIPTICFSNEPSTIFVFKHQLFSEICRVWPAYSDMAFSQV